MRLQMLFAPKCCLAAPLLGISMLLLLLTFDAASAAADEQATFAEYGSSNLGSIATGSGRIFRPTRRDPGMVEEVAPLVGEVAEIEEPAEPVLLKRSMSLGRLAFRPGKRRFLPMAGAFAHDPQRGRYEFLFMDDHAEGAEAVPVEGIKGANNLRFRLLPTMIDSDEDANIEYSPIAEYSMGKRSSLASGRIGWRPAKRSMAVGRTGFRPGKRSIATGRVRFRPGKRAVLLASQPVSQDGGQEELPFITF